MNLYPYDLTKEQYEDMYHLLNKFGGCGVKWFTWNGATYMWGGDSRDRTSAVIYSAYFKVKGIDKNVPTGRLTPHEYSVYCAFIDMLTEYMHTHMDTGGVVA